MRAENRKQKTENATELTTHICHNTQCRVREVNLSDQFVTFCIVRTQKYAFLRTFMFAKEVIMIVAGLGSGKRRFEVALFLPSVRLTFKKARKLWDYSACGMVGQW